MRPVRFLPQARDELRESQAYYDRARSGLGSEFLAEVERIVNMLRERPRLGAPGPASTRRFSLRRFPYSVIYRVESDELLIVAVAHHRRRPGYWRSRTQ